MSFVNVTEEIIAPTRTKSVMDKLLFVRQGGEVRRFHTCRRIKEENVAEHSFGVAWLVYLLTDGNCGADLLMQALVHDVAEQETGDIPAPFKRAMGMRGTMNEMEEEILAEHELPLDLLPPAHRWVLKLADALDGMLSCCREAEMGNTLLDGIFLTYNDYVTKLLEEQSHGPHVGIGAAAVAANAAELREEIVTRWENT